MPIPDFQSLMFPVLKASAEGEVRISDVIKKMIVDFGLTTEEAERLNEGSRQTTISNRTQWAKFHLGKAGLIETTKRGVFKITEQGRSVLAENPIRIDLPYLRRFEKFRRFRDGESETSLPDTSQEIGRDAVPVATPDELLRSTIKQIDQALAQELLNRIVSGTPSFFESVVVSLLLAMGYGGSREGAGRTLGRSGDGGLDGVIDQDALGLDRIYLQAKRYAVDNGVGAPALQAFSGALSAAKATKGVFVTTSYFTSAATAFVDKLPFKIILIDGALLTALMIRHNVGTRIEETLYIKKIDEDFFSED